MNLHFKPKLGNNCYSINYLTRMASAWGSLKHQVLCHTSYATFSVGSVESDASCPSEQEEILNGERPVVNCSFMPGPQPCPHFEGFLFCSGWPIC